MSHDPTPGMPDDLFRVPEQAAVDEGDSAFAPVDQDQVFFGAPAPSASAETAPQAGDFVAAVADVQEPVAPVPPVAPVAQPVPPVAPVAQPVPPVPPVAQPVPPVAQPVPPVAPVQPVAPVPPVAPVAQPVPPVEHAAFLPPNHPQQVEPVPPVVPVAQPVPPVAPVAQPVAPAAPVTGGPFAQPTPAGTQFTPSDTLQPSKAAARGGALKKYAIGGLAAAVVGGIAVGGYAFATGFFGTGTQPEDVLPADTIAFAKIDLNPGADQKVNAFRLLQKFPKVTVNDEDLKATLFADAFNENPYGLTYATDVAPWAGDRAAFAAVPAPGTDDGVTPVVVIEFTDQEKATAALDRLIAAEAKDTLDQPTAVEPAPGTGPDNEPFAYYAVRDTYLIVADNQAEVDKIAATETTLATDPAFADDKTALDGTGKPALVWADLGRIYDAIPAEEKIEFEQTLGTTSPVGRVGAVLNIAPDYVEMVGQTRGVTANGLDTTLATQPGTSLVRGFPAETDLAFSATGLGEAFTSIWNDLDADPATGGFLGMATTEAKNLGIRLPADLGPVFGTELAVGATLTADGGHGALAVTSPDPARAVKVLKPLLDLSGEPDLAVARTDDGYVAATNKKWLTAAKTGNGDLGTNPIFTTAVADAENAHAIFYLNLASLLDTFGDFFPAEDRADLAPLQAIGISATGNNTDGQFTMRLTTR